MIKAQDNRRDICLIKICLVGVLWALGESAIAQSTSTPAGTIVSAASTDKDSASIDSQLSFEDLKIEGARRSKYLTHQPDPSVDTVPEPQLAAFRNEVRPILQKACVQCHGADTQEGNIRIDTLNPDLVHGADVSWWLEIVSVVSNGEMPPADADELSDADRAKVIDWLTSEIQMASTVRRAEQGHSSFRRLTRYEYNYALQYLLGLPYDFSLDLPPESVSEDGFQNSSEMLHMSASQFATYRELSLKALKRATVIGPRPAQLHWGLSMQAASEKDFAKHQKDLLRITKENQGDPEKLKAATEEHNAQLMRRPNGIHYKNLATGEAIRASWSYPGAAYAWAPADRPSEIPVESAYVAIIPRRQRLTVELGDQIPEEGLLRVRVRACRTSAEDDLIPSLQLEFGWQASNDSQASVRISDQDLAIDAAPGHPQFYQWEVPLSEIYPRNSVRRISKMGDLPSPSEYIRLVNSSVSQGDIQIDFVEVVAPVFHQWPPESHTRIFFESATLASPSGDGGEPGDDSEPGDDGEPGDNSEPVDDRELKYARVILSRFMTRAWRRPVSDSEVDQKVALFSRLRPACDDFQDAMLEVLATVLSSPNFLYLVQANNDSGEAKGISAADGIHLAEAANQFELASRLSFFLWSSLPDDQLLQLAQTQRLNQPDELAGQVRRMLSDPRSERFSRNFVRQWLGMHLLDYLKVDRKVYPQFDPFLKDAMQQETIAFFDEVLHQNASVLDFIHADYAVVNERLAQHYGLTDVKGNHFRRVSLPSQNPRGGLLTQAGLLAMNSDGKDSHPLKRGIWLLERLLNDPPPPPPAAVPRIDLTDPEIALLTVKQRIERHRDQAACMSCHAKIDPWGIAFENYDAVGSWRTQIQGQPVDASSLLFNRQKLDGTDGLKRFLLEHRQDQFVRALVHKMTTYALGRPLTFADRSSVEQIAADLRRQGDGLATMIEFIVTSPLFQSNQRLHPDQHTDRR